jgi:hypothetical protein
VCRPPMCRAEGHDVRRFWSLITLWRAPKNVAPSQFKPSGRLSRKCISGFTGSPSAPFFARHRRVRHHLAAIESCGSAGAIRLPSEPQGFVFSEAATGPEKTDGGSNRSNADLSR